MKKEAIKLRTVEEVLSKIDEINKKLIYLQEFLETLYTGDNIKKKVEKKLTYLRKESELLLWFVNDYELPFLK